jgi:predicted glycoside hydrolase/deacetylase ChbG (UPF0249 family)
MRLPRSVSAYTSKRMSRLIVNADDFGFTRGINRAIGELAQAGGVTSTTLMANAAEAPDAIAIKKTIHRLGVGCHLVLVDGTPISEPASVASLLEPGTNRLYGTLGSFLAAMFRGRIQNDHLVTEATAQIRRARGLGIEPTHVDTHKHTHMFPQVLDAVLKAMHAEGMRVLRNPFEPYWAVAASAKAGAVRKLEVTTLARLYRKQFLQSVRSNGIVTTDGAIGVAATGSLDCKTLQRLLRAMPEGTWELVCHPGYVDESLRARKTRLLESRATEIEALRQLPSVLPSHTQLINFAELTA